MERDAKTFDENLEIKDAGLIAADDICQVDSADAIIDLGTGHVEGDLIVQATAVEVASGDEMYTLGLQFSDSATFASSIKQGAMFALGDAAVIGPLFTAGSADMDNGVGRYVIPFNNTFAGVHYRYVRLAVEVVGTIATGVNFIAHLAKD